MRVALVILLALLPPPAVAVAGGCERIEVWRAGRPDGSVCRAGAAARGLTAIDLGDDWVPRILAAGPRGTGPGYRATYLALARERFADAGADGVLAARDRYLEMFGIAPSLGVVQARLRDDARHLCHDGIDDAALALAPTPIVEEPVAAATARVTRARALRATLERARVRLRRPSLAALGAGHASYHHELAHLAAMEAHLAAVRAVQAHLACDGLLGPRPIEAAYTWQTSHAVETFQRGAMLLPTGILDAPTREALVRDSRERDFRTALRVLRERVAAATGLIEDGTAGVGPRPVLGRALDAEATWRVRGHGPLDRAAPDLLSPATEAAARALGWRDAASARGFLDRLAAAGRGARVVAVPLPARPAYHGPAMQLSIVIDRGDVWLDPAPRRREVERRPALIVYAAAGGRRIPLARWPTTIGGWQREELDGSALRWKESPAGPRLWRELYVGPTWLPPELTPDRELVRRIGGRHALARELFGPSYRSAFGMIAFVHQAGAWGRGRVEASDEGIRTHATGNLRSLVDGTSHGCHRLFGHHAVRLAGFVLAHRGHVRRGDTPTAYRRVVRYGGVFPIEVGSLGYRIELVAPIPVEVLPGRVLR